MDQDVFKKVTPLVNGLPALCVIARSCNEEHLQAHLYMGDPQWALSHRSHGKTDWLYYFLTLTKIVEIYLLYYHGALHIIWITRVICAYFFFFAIILQLFDSVRMSYLASIRSSSTNSEDSQCLASLVGA